MQTVLYKIYARVTDSISCADNRYAKRASHKKESFSGKHTKQNRFSI